jgi:hypothetical protein
MRWRARGGIRWGLVGPGRALVAVGMFCGKNPSDHTHIERAWFPPVGVPSVRIRGRDTPSLHQNHLS